MRVEHVKVEHIMALRSQSSHSCISERDVSQIKKAEEATYAYSLFIDDELVLCAGVAEYWEGRGEAWAILSERSRNNFLKIHNAVKRFLEICPLTRIEASVEIDFEQGHRWAKSLGFVLETERASKFLPNGKDASIYARVRH